MHEPIYKTDTKIEAKRLQSYKIFMGSIREKFNIGKINKFTIHKNIISHFGSPIIFSLNVCL